jgi:hypothetical protein
MHLPTLCKISYTNKLIEQENSTFIAQYWLVPGTDSSVFVQLADIVQHNRTKMKLYKLN